jgi:hypothetical protein
MNLFGVLADMGFQAVGASGQRRLAKLAYSVYRGTKAGKASRAVEWIDLTQREQEEWTASVGDVLDKWID